MKKLFCVLSIVFIFISLLGANNANIPVVTASTDELVEVTINPGSKVVSDAKRAADSLNVLFALAYNNGQDWLRNALVERDSLIANVDYMNAITTLARLEDFMDYDVVLTWPNNPYFHVVAMGDTLAAYVDLGGKVITCAFCWYRLGSDLEGAIMDPTYNPFNSPSGDNHHSDTTLGLYDDTHPMMEGVTTFSERYRDSLQVNA